MRHAPDDPAFDDFNAALEPVNAAAESSPGFVWRLVSDEHDSPNLAEFEAAGWLVNMSVWESIDQLRGFVRSPKHLAIMKQRAKWFETVDVSMCLWWVPDGHRPSFDEAMARLEHLRLRGPTAYAFDFTRTFQAPGG